MPAGDPINLETILEMPHLANATLSATANNLTKLTPPLDRPEAKVISIRVSETSYFAMVGTHGEALGAGVAKATLDADQWIPLPQTSRPLYLGSASTSVAVEVLVENRAD